MYKVIKITTNNINSHELMDALNDGYVIISVNETHCDNIGLIVYVLKKDN